MKNLDTILSQALTKSSMTIAWCWLIARLDGLQLGFTSLDVAFEIDGVVYQPWTGFDPGASQQSLDASKVDSQQLKGILDDSGISQAELSAGLYAYSSVRRFLVDYTNLPSSLSLVPPKHIELPPGHLAQSKINSLGYEIKVKDDLAKLENEVGTTTSKTCRCKQVGDDICRVDLTNFTHALTVTAVDNKRVFDIASHNANLPDKWFNNGRLQFSSGANSGLWLDVGFYVGGKIILSPVPAPFEIEVGDTIIAIAGCARTKLACITKFQNFHNFDGEPDVPTTDLSIETPAR